MTDNTRMSNQNWFHISYTDLAPEGLPPVLQAESIARYADETGSWLVVLWEREETGDDAVSACILRLPADQVARVTRHRDMAEAANQFDLATPPALTPTTAALIARVRP